MDVASSRREHLKPVMQGLGITLFLAGIEIKKIKLCWNRNQSRNQSFTGVDSTWEGLNIRLATSILTRISIFPSRVSGRGYKIGPVCVFVCLSVIQCSHGRTV